MCVIIIELTFHNFDSNLYILVMFFALAAFISPNCNEATVLSQVICYSKIKKISKLFNSSLIPLHIWHKTQWSKYYVWHHDNDTARNWYCYCWLSMTASQLCWADYFQHFGLEANFIIRITTVFIWPANELVASLSPAADRLTM